MNSNDLELAFYGELQTGFNEPDVKASIAELFKASVDQVERMFAGQRVVIRNKLDIVTADKYVQAMAKRGAVCKVELMGQPGVEYDRIQGADQTPSSPPEQAEVKTPTNTPSEHPTAIEEPANGLPVAGEKVNTILASSSLTLDPVGVRLSEEENPPAELALRDLADVELLPPGSDLVDATEEIPVTVPDTSHISLKDE